MAQQVWRGWRVFASREKMAATTWTRLLVVLLFAVVICSFTRGFWIPAIAQGLVCTGEAEPSDAILVENFDPDYLVFERAAALQEAGFSKRVLIPVDASRREPREASVVDRGIAELMARIARIRKPEILPVRSDAEPISLHSALEIRDFLGRAHLESVIVVAPAFRSRRSSLVYHAVLTPARIRVYCVPVFGQHTLRNWTGTWHGIQDVSLQFIKLQFYRLDVLPRVRKEAL